MKAGSSRVPSTATRGAAYLFLIRQELLGELLGGQAHFILEGEEKGELGLVQGTYRHWELPLLRIPSYVCSAYKPPFSPDI